MTRPADLAVDPLDRAAASVLALLGSDGESSLPRLCKRLQLPRSELQRLLLLLAEPAADACSPGLGLVCLRDQDGRVLVSLTSRGRALVGAGR